MESSHPQAAITEIAPGAKLPCAGESFWPNLWGAIMGIDPGNSVTNKYGQVWDTPNVFVTGATLFPQNAGMNPIGTMLTLAYLTGDGIVNQYLDAPGEIISFA